MFTIFPVKTICHNQFIAEILYAYALYPLSGSTARIETLHLLHLYKHLNVSILIDLGNLARVNLTTGWETKNNRTYYSDVLGHQFQKFGMRRIHEPRQCATNIIDTHLLGYISVNSC